MAKLLTVAWIEIARSHTPEVTYERQSFVAYALPDSCRKSAIRTPLPYMVAFCSSSSLISHTHDSTANNSDKTTGLVSRSRRFWLRDYYTGYSSDFQRYVTSRIYEHNADVCNFPGMSGNYAHAHAIFTRRYFSLDQRLGTRLQVLLHN